MATQYSAKAPGHLWVVGILTLLWNAFGAVDYTMTELGNLDYFNAMGLGAEELAFFSSLPAWAVAVWAIGVWGSVLGSILLLLRSRHAATAFLISIVGAVASFAYQFTSPDMPVSLTSGVNAVMPIVILIAIAAQWYYARRVAASGVLR